MSWRKVFDRVRLNSLIYTKKKCTGEQVHQEFESKLEKDIETVLETIFSDGDGYTVSMSIDYLVHASLWDMFEYFPRYLDRFLPRAHTSPFKNGSDEFDDTQCLYPSMKEDVLKNASCLESIQR